MSGHTQKQGKGHGTHYDVGSGDWIELQKNRSPQPGIFLAYGKRFCETCHKLKPSDGRKSYKGWKCADCKKQKKSNVD